MSKNKQRLWIFLIILTYAAIAIIGFLIVYLIKSTFFHKSSPITTAARTNTTPKPAGWKTYTDADYHLTFFYPSNDMLKPSSYEFGVTNLQIKNKNGAADFQILLLSKILAAAIGQDFDVYYALPDNTTKLIKSPLAKDDTMVKFTKIRNRSLHGRKAIDYQSLPSHAKVGSQPEIGTFVESGNNLILISTEEKTKGKLEQLLNSITTTP